MEQFKELDYYVKELIAAFKFQKVALSPVPLKNSPGEALARGYFHKLCGALLTATNLDFKAMSANPSAQMQGKMRKTVLDNQLIELKGIAREATRDCIKLMQDHIDAMLPGLYSEQVDEFEQLKARLAFARSKIDEGEYPVEFPVEQMTGRSADDVHGPVQFNIKEDVIAYHELLHGLLAENVLRPKQVSDSDQAVNAWLQTHNHQASLAPAHQYRSGHNFDLILNPEKATKRLVVLVHGLNGNNPAYWGSLPQCIMMDHGNSVDVARWHYDTDLLPRFRAVAALRRNPLLQEWSKIAACLLDDISSIQKVSGRIYERVSLIGHSQGGLVSIEAAYQNMHRKTGPNPVNAIPLFSVCLSDMPTKANLFAKLNRLGTLNSNAHTRLLGSKREVSEVVGTKLDNVKKEIPFWQIMSLADEVLGSAQHEIEGLIHKNHQNQHNWMSECHSLTHQAASRIDDFLRSTILKD